HAALVAHHRERREGVGAATLFQAADFARAVGFAGDARWNVARDLADTIADLHQRQAEGFQRRRRDLDRDALLGQAGDADPIDAGGEQFLLEASDPGPQFLDAVAAHEQAGDRLVARYATDFGGLGVARQVAELIHALAHLVEGEQ